MYIIFDIFYLLLLPLLIFFYLIKGKYHKGWLERICLGRWHKILSYKDPLIWIHAVSVGEANLALLLYRKLKSCFPTFRFLLTTITPTGQLIAERGKDKNDFCAYLPLDISFIWRMLFRKLKLVAIFILETEIWPNMILLASFYKIPIFLINARMSRSSFKRYRIIKHFIKGILNKFSAIIISSKSSHSYFLALGVEKKRCYIIGSLKYALDLNLKEQDDKRLDALKKLIAEHNLFTIVAGSTHEGEEEIISDVYHNLQEIYHNLYLILVPRHPERSQKIAEKIKQNNLDYQFFSQGFYNRDKILIVDEIGLLNALYSIADIAIVAGSFLPYGGHNILEPAYFAKPVISGPYFDNFIEIVSEFLEEGAIIIVRNQKELSLKLEELIKDVNLRHNIGMRAKAIVERNKNIIDDYLKIIVKNIS